MISLRTIFESDIGTTAIKNFFLIHDHMFDSQDLNVISLFQYNPFESNWTLNLSVIQPFNDHLLHIICTHNLDLYFYIINWISYLFQKSVSKTKQH
jgi:hypothetical protein